ncbi:MAG: OmpA family protein [Porphyrobacter sp.]|nr:OmpA family protein [Porphyrobacter sp.]
MKVRYSVFAAALAGACFAAPAFAVEDEKSDAENYAKWVCLIDKKCDGEVTAVVGDGVDSEGVRPLIGPNTSRPKPAVVAAAPKPAAAPRNNLGASGNGARQLSAGRRQVDGGPVAVPSDVRDSANLFVTFRKNSAALESGITGDMRLLARAVNESLAAGNQRVIQIGGFTDATGDDEFNLKLSQERAETVRKSLMELGVPSDAIQSVGYGETRLIEGYAPTHGINRRVEVVVLN